MVVPSGVLIMHHGGLFTRNNLCHEFANLRIISFSHTENRGKSRNNLSLSRIRELSNFLIVTRNITESHGDKNSIIRVQGQVSGQKDKIR